MFWTAVCLKLPSSCCKSQLSDYRRTWCSSNLAEAPQQTAQERPAITSDWVIIHFRVEEFWRLSMRVLLAGLLSAIRRYWFPAAYISLDRWRQGEGEEQSMVWVSPMSHHSGWPIRGDGGLLTCLAWWAPSGWHSCNQHPSMLNQMAEHDQIICPLTTLHRDILEINLKPAFTTHLPLATGSNALWRSMPYTPFSSLLESVSQEGFQKQ